MLVFVHCRVCLCEAVCVCLYYVCQCKVYKIITYVCSTCVGARLYMCVCTTCASVYTYFVLASFNHGHIWRLIKSAEITPADERIQQSRLQPPIKFHLISYKRRTFEHFRFTVYIFRNCLLVELILAVWLFL